MSGISRSQVAIYAGIAVVLLLVGLNSIKGSSAEPEVVSGHTDSHAETRSNAASPGFSVGSGSSRLVVDVSGGVRRPGVYRLKQGSRVIDAIVRAGGATARALPGAVNRAAKLADGQQVMIPLAAGTGSAAAAGAGAASPEAPVSLGAATSEQLEEIDGIGPVTAEKIIEFRDSNGGVGSIDDLDQVSGIGPVTMEALRSGLQP